MKNKSKKFLQDSKPSYTEGLEIFAACASSEMKAKYGEFLKLKNDKPTPLQENMLRSKIKAIYLSMGLYPDRYPKLQISEDTGKAGNNNTADGDSSPIRYENFPPGTKKLYDRTREITPLMASLHADLSKTDISDEQRKTIAEELCKLDEERRAAWDKLDEWAAGKKVVFDEPKTIIGYTEDSVVKGAQMANRAARLRDNIARTEAKMSSYTENNLARAQRRVEEQKKELAELEKQLNEAAKV